MKRKSIYDSISEVATADRSVRLKLMEMKEEARTKRVIERERLKREATAKVELTRLMHAREEADKQRAHDLAMFDCQLQLERLRRGAVRATLVGVNSGLLRGIPSYIIFRYNTKYNTKKSSTDLLRGIPRE